MVRVIRSTPEYHLRSIIYVMRYKVLRTSVHLIVSDYYVYMCLVLFVVSKILDLNKLLLYHVY